MDKDTKGNKNVVIIRFKFKLKQVIQNPQMSVEGASIVWKSSSCKFIFFLLSITCLISFYKCVTCYINIELKNLYKFSEINENDL